MQEGLALQLEDLREQVAAVKAATGTALARVQGEEEMVQRRRSVLARAFGNENY